MKIKLLLLLLPGVLALQAQEVLTLPMAVKMSLQNNFSIILQNNAAAISRNNNTPGSAGMLPTLNWTGTQNNTVYTTDQRSFTGTEKHVDNAMNTSVNTGLQLSWTLFDGLNMFASKQMLGVLQNLGETNSRAVLENTIADVVLAYCNIIQWMQAVEVSKTAIALSQERLSIAEARFSLGSGSELSVMQSRVDLNADSALLIQQRMALDNACADMNFILARDPITPFIIADSLSRMGLPSYEQLLARAMSQNTRLIAARMDEQLSKLDLRTAEAARYPKINFQSGYNFIRQKSQTGFAEYNQSYGPYFGLTASYTIFNGRNITRDIRNARLMLGSSETALQQTDLDVRTSLLKLHRTYVNTLDIIRLQEQNLLVADANVKAALEKYRLGSYSDTELREVQMTRLNAGYQLLQSQLEAKKAEIELLRICGDLPALF